MKVTADKANTAGLSSLNRNYHAYLNSNDPRMAAISAYAIAYAEFEAENGPDVIPTDPALSDEALRDALASFTKDGVVTDDTLETAKDILGVGPESARSTKSVTHFRKRRLRRPRQRQQRRLKSILQTRPSWPARI